MTNDEKIELLIEYSGNLKLVQDGTAHDPDAVRQFINRKKTTVKQIVVEAGVFHTLTISPPPAVGGMVLRNVDLFNVIYNPPHLMNLVPDLIDMIEGAIGSIEGGALDVVPVNEVLPDQDIKKNFAFVAMTMDPADKALEDVLDTVKAVATEFAIEAERVDEQQNNERITDRILDSIRVAEYVIVDLSGARPNVYYEAGYAQGLGKLPIYLAKSGTQLEFDVKDYPVIFYGNMRELREGLNARLAALTEK